MPLNIVVSDDCAYSGQHIHETFWEVSRALRDMFPKTPIRFHCIVPFMSTRALKLLFACSKMGAYPSLQAEFQDTRSMELQACNISVHLYHQEVIPTFNEQLKKYIMPPLNRMIGSAVLNLQFFGDKAPLFFQHKIADSLSVPRTLLRGRLIHSAIKRPFLDETSPPYKA